MKYRFLRHTADAKFQAFGYTLEEAFCNAALATASLMWEWQKVEKKIKYSVDVTGNDLEQLLVNFLEEILYLLDTRMFLLGSAEIVEIKKKEAGYFLEACFWGDKSSDLYKIFGEAKAITYNEIRIESNDSYKLQVVVDV